MGNVWDKSIVKKDEVEKNISKINEITKNFSLIELTGFFLVFSVSEKKMSNKIIKVTVKKFNPNKGIVEDKKEKIRLTIDEFYSYYNALMNSLSSFYQTRFEEKLTAMKKEDVDNLGIDESSLCPICDERKVEISLPCSHFFCEKCINDWVIKSDTCPLCRFKLKYKNNSKQGAPSDIEGIDKWSVLTNDDNTKQEIKKDNIDILLKLTRHFFGTKEK